MTRRKNLKRSFTESYLWDRMKDSFFGFDLSRHENMIGRGTPDVSYGVNKNNGWIELKTYNSYRENSVPPFSDFTRKQRIWLKDRGRVGGNCWILVSFGEEIMLIHWTHIDLLGEVEYHHLRGLSSWSGRIGDFPVLAKTLCRLSAKRL